MAAANVNRIRMLYIDRVEDSRAYTDEQHDKMDIFRLRAALGSRIGVILCEVKGKENIPLLQQKMHEITDSAGL